MNKIKAIIKSLRIHSYIKNGFVVAPIIFTNKLDEMDILKQVIGGGILFCMISSAVYIINDIRDIEVDRQHFEKRKRPIASGELSVSAAWVIALFLSIFSILGSYFLNKEFLMYVLLYYGLQLGYSIWLKRVSIIESLIVAAGFVIRVMAGGILVYEPASEWIILATFFLALVLVLGKRRCEYVKRENGEIKEVRPVLKNYTIMWLDLSMSIAVAAAILTYALYSISERGIFIGGKRMIYSLLPVVLGLLRYMQLISLGKMDEDIGQLLFRDIILLLSIVTWVIMIILFIYF